MTRRKYPPLLSLLPQFLCISYEVLIFSAGFLRDVLAYRFEISAEERFYKQEYCGCAYSLRDSNTWRKAQGIPPVKIGGTEAGLGTRHFEDPEKVCGCVIY